MTSLTPSARTTSERDPTVSTSHNRTPSAAVLSYTTRGAVTKPFVEIENLIWLVLHQDDRREISELRLAGYTGGPVPWGVGWGGAERMLFEKNLHLQPQFGARGRRLNLRQANVVRHARRMKRILRLRPNAQKVAIRERIQLPRLWAAFDKAMAETITGDGPEFSGMCHLTGQSPSELLVSSQRTIGNLIAFPLDWVSHAWEKIVQIYADLERFPRYQVVPFGNTGASLRGYRGACEFDFYETRFATPSTKPFVSIEEGARNTSNEEVCEITLT